MITVTFFKSGKVLTGFTADGHSGYSEQGSDIICAALSSATIMAANTITEIQHINADVTDRDGFINLKLSQGDAIKAQDILMGLQLHLNALSEQYNKYIKVKYSEV